MIHLAKVSIKLGDAYVMRISKLSKGSDEIIKKAVYNGAGIVADAIRSNISSLPETSFRYLQNGEKFEGVPEDQKQALLDGLGISPIETDDKGNINAKIGFDGYGAAPTKKYPQGLPIPMLARSVESGSSVRVKTPFVRPAVESSQAEAENTMKKTVDEEIKKIMGV